MTRSARFAALGAAFLFSTGGAAIKVAAFSPLQVSACRSGIAALVLLFWYRHQLAWTRWIPAATLAYAATLTLFVAATRLTTAANAIFLQYTAPIYLLALAPWLLREHVSRRDLVYIAALALGMVFCFFGQTRATVTAPSPDLGNLLGVASGVTWALTLVALRHLNRDIRETSERGPGEPGLTAVIAGSALACLIALPWSFPMPSATAAEWLTLVYLGLVQVGLAYVCLTIAMRRLPALEVSLLLLIEPVLNPLWTWIVRGEAAAGATLAGGAVIIGATAIRTWMSRPG
jgi:drug/metabolite transporter (DMT)-like permease